jgi:2-keto-3-deoxy-L-rhamnonate aldolase RhmA
MTPFPENPARAKLARGETVLCMSVRLARTVEIAVMARACGFDALYVDMAHAAMSVEVAGQICIAANLAGIASFVRVPHDPVTLARVLDNGALGVIVPQVDTPEQARAVAEACRFPPRGGRSVSGPGAALGYAQMGVVETAAALDERTLVVAMIESPEAVGNADAIAAVPGIDILLVGTSDLTATLAAAGRAEPAALTSCYETVAAACRAHGKTFGIAGVRNDPDRLAGLVALGARFLTAGNDQAYMLAEGRRQAGALREAARRGEGRA